MILATLFSILIPFVFGFLLVWHAWPAQEPRPALLFPVLALPAGWSLTSACYFLWLVLSGGRSSWYPGIELALLAAAAGVTALRCRRDAGFFRSGWQWRSTLSPSTGLAFLALLAAAILGFAISIRLASVNPWGYWDAWSRINVKATFLFTGDWWGWIFQNSGIPHQDYPLLIPATVAHSWTWGGAMTHFAPQLLSILWGAWSLLILVGLVAWLATPQAAALAGLAYLAFLPLSFWASTQYSDLPLACYLILACGMLVAAERHPGAAGRFAFLGGFFAGSAAWCKNEGVAFLAVAALWWGLLTFRKGWGGWRRVPLGYLAGAALAGSATAVLKVFYAGKTDIIAGQTSVAGMAQHLASGERHRAILGSLIDSLAQLPAWPPLALLAAAALLRIRWDAPRLAHWRPLAAVGTLAALYYAVFLTTPLDLNFHLGTALDRLLLQLWPLAVFGLALLTGAGPLAVPPLQDLDPVQELHDQRQGVEV